jgi:hypothetical protein
MRGPIGTPRMAGEFQGTHYDFFIAAPLDVQRYVIGLWVPAFARTTGEGCS